MSSTPDKWCYTIRKEKKLLFKWRIENFSCDVEDVPSSDLPSSNFEFRREDLEYYLTLNIIGSNCEERECEVVLDDNSNSEWKFSVSLSLLDKDGQMHSRSFILNNVERTAYLKLFDKQRCCLLPENEITILCEVILVYYKAIDSWKNRRFRIIKSKSNFDLAELFATKKHWDVTLVVAGHELHAHKCILASRSKVFAAMFEHEMKEAKSNKVAVDDIDLDVFDDMLHYIYTNEVLNLNKNASELLAASDKYDLPNLRSLCETELAHNISVNNAVERLILADLYRAQELKEHAMDYINANRKAIAKTDSWQKILNKYNHLLAELYLKIDEN